MTRALHAEWTKQRTLPGTLWLLAAAALLTIAVSVAAVAATTCRPGDECPVDTAKLSLTGVQFGQAVVAILAVLTVGGEYSTGMIRTTLTAIPRRSTLLAAKAATVTVPVLATATIAVLGSLLAARLLLPGRGLPTTSLSDGAVLRAAAGSVLYLALIALLSLGLAAAVRDSAIAIGLVLGLLFLFPIIAAAAANPHWQRRLEQIGPMKRRADDPGHHQPAQPGDRPVARPLRARRVGGRRTARRRTAPAVARRLTDLPGAAGVARLRAPAAACPEPADPVRG